MSDSASAATHADNVQDKLDDLVDLINDGSASGGQVAKHVIDHLGEALFEAHSSREAFEQAAFPAIEEGLTYAMVRAFGVNSVAKELLTPAIVETTKHGVDLLLRKYFPERTK